MKQCKNRTQAVLIQHTDPNKLFFYEKYADLKAVEYHTTTAHFKDFFGRMGPIMKGRPEIARYEEV